MSIVSEPIHGLVLVGTITGDTLASFPYYVPPGAHAGPPLAEALQRLWLVLPETLLRNGPGKFAFLVRQGNGGPDPAVDLYHASGLIPSTLFCTIAAKLLKARIAALQAQARAMPQGMTVTEVEDDGTVEWTPPDHVGRVLRQLADPWGNRP